VACRASLATRPVGFHTKETPANGRPLLEIDADLLRRRAAEAPAEADGGAAGEAQRERGKPGAAPEARAGHGVRLPRAGRPAVDGAAVGVVSLVAHAPHSVGLSQLQPQLGCAGQNRTLAV